MRIAVIIPSRYASTRLPAKPLVKIAGKAMIQRVYERAMMSKIATDVAVATDDTRIYDAVTAFGGKCIMTSETCKSGTDRVYEAAKKLGLELNDIVVNVQGDQPVFEPDIIDEVARPLVNDPETGMSTLAYEIINKREITDPKDCKVVFDNNGWALYFSRAPIPFGRDTGLEYPVYKHLGIYAYTMAFLEKFTSLPTGRLENIEKLEQLRALESGLGIKIVVTKHDSLEVDLPEDIRRIEIMLKKDSRG